MHKITELQNEIARLQRQVKEEKEQLRIDYSNLSKEEKMAKAMELPSIPDQLYEDMQDYGFKTGSSVYSNVDKPGDIDWVVTMPARAFVQTGCAIFCGADMTDYLDDAKDFVPLYANRDGILYNIICISGSDKYNAWKDTTEILEEMNRIYPKIAEAIKTKWKRVRIFRAICDILEEVRPLSSWEQRNITLADRLKWHSCITCGREATNFMYKASRDTYEATGICERCQTIGD